MRNCVPALPVEPAGGGVVGGPHEKRSGARKYPVTSNFHSPVSGSAAATGASDVVVTRPPTCGASGFSPSAGALPPFFFGGVTTTGAAAGVTAGAAGGGASSAKAGDETAGSASTRLARTNDRLTGLSRPMFLVVMDIAGTLSNGRANAAACLYRVGGRPEAVADVRRTFQRTSTAPKTGVPATGFAWHRHC